MGNRRTLRDLLDDVAARGDSPAAMAFGAEGTVDSITAADLGRFAYALASRLVRSGVHTGEPVVLIGPNRIEWIVGYCGILCSGALPVVLDAQSGPELLSRLIADCGARRAVTTGPLAKMLQTEAKIDLAVVPLEELRMDEETLVAAGRTGELSGLLPGLREEDPAALFYTSGTTGTPKGVPLTHRNLLSNVQALVAAHLIDEGGRVLLPLPLHHVYPFTCGMLGCLATGAVLVMPAGVTGPQLTAAIRGAGVTVLLGVPRLYTALLAGIEARVDAAGSRRLFERLLSVSTAIARGIGFRAGCMFFRKLHEQMGPTLRILVSGGARLDPAIAWRLEGLGWEVLSGYGLTETAPILTFNIPGQVRHESAGRPLPGVEIRIDALPASDAEAQRTPTPGDCAEPAGEIIARGPNVFAGYRNHAEATRNAFTPDGWLRTGDVGYVDADGYLHILGRVRELIALADGKKLAPEEVEPCYANPLIREIALLEHRGRLVALIVPDEAAMRERGAARIARSLRESIEMMSMRLPAYQRITDYRLAHAPLPRTPMGKLQRFRLPGIFAAADPAARTAAQSELSTNDRALVESAIGAPAWSWLQARFSGKSVTLDASPQLDLGVDSLEWLTLTLEIRDRFGVSLGQEAIARVLTVRDLLREIIGAQGIPEPADEASALERVQGFAEPTPALRAFGMLLYAIDRLIMRIYFRLRVEGADNLPAEAAFVLTPNHASYLDPLAIAAALPWGILRRLRWAGWSAFMFRPGYWRLLSRSTGVFAVDPDRDVAAAIAAGRKVLESGRALVWFPEGRRSLTGELTTFLPGIGMVLREAGAVAVPVQIDGAFDALPWTRRWPRPARITVRFGKPIGSAELEAMGEGDSRAQRIAAGLRRAVMQLSEAR